MARSTPRVDGSVLVGATAANRIAVGSQAWYTWLKDTATFAFTSTQDSFTAPGAS